MNQEQFRARFPALRTWAWLDTPGSPPGALPVLRRLERTLSDWEEGSFDWTSWDVAADECRSRFAEFVAVPTEWVAAVGSLSEALATVLPGCAGGEIVVAEDEFRSVLYPVLTQHAESGQPIKVVPRVSGISRTESLLQAIDRQTRLVVVSEVITLDGERVDLERITDRAHEVDAEVFVNLTQSLGVLRRDLAGLKADYAAVHGYKWMLCPRGAAWLVADPDRHSSITPLAPNWKTGSDRGLFGTPLTHSPTASRWDTSPAWFSWIGAQEAIQLLAAVDAHGVEAHCLALASDFTSNAAELGFSTPNKGAQSHIVVVTDDTGAAPFTRALLDRHTVRALGSGDRLRVGIHYFNDETDIDRALAVLRDARS